MDTAETTFSNGQHLRWTGLRGLFDHAVTVVRSRMVYLTIFGEGPEDARRVYDIYDTVTRMTVLGIPAGQLHTGSED
jgi:hypothetical protein